MKVDESQYHVFALNVEEQVTVRLLAENHLKLLTKAYMREIEQGAVSVNTWERWLSSFQKFDDLTGNMATVQTMDMGAPKLFNFNDIGMKYILKIFECYDPTHCQQMESDAMQFIEENHADLKKKLEDASMFTYSQDEIKAAVHGKKK